MFITVQANEYHKYPELIDQMFRLRKRVFADDLGWDVPVQGEYERDAYDNQQPVYLMWTNEETTILYAVVRMMPTTGPTLLYDVFYKTFPEVIALHAPGIWEATRLCIDTDKLKKDHPEIDPAKATAMIFMASYEVCLAHGIHTVVSNYEPQMKRIYQRSGAAFMELGRADDYGKRPVCCGQFEISKTVLQQMRKKIGISKALYAKNKPQRTLTSLLAKAA